MVSFALSRICPGVHYTNHGLDLWDIAIGPVSTANITTTVAATAVPASSLVPPPFLASYSFPPGQQVAEVVTNSSWSFPEDFKLGVAGAAFQVEGAAKDEGRGPSVWDRLVCPSLHDVCLFIKAQSDIMVTQVRVPGYTVVNDTGDITDNHYYLYKQGQW